LPASTPRRSELALRATTTLSVPLRRRRFSYSLGVGVGAQYTRSVDRVGPASDLDALLSRCPPGVTRPQATMLVLDWGYVGHEAYRDSVSPERGVTSFVRLRVGDERAFSDVDVAEVYVDVDAFSSGPGLPNHVVAACLSGGATFDDRPGALFVAGGLVGRDLLQDVLGGQRGAPGALRGFPGAHLVGDALAAATLESRLPLWKTERGVDTLPLFAQRLHDGAFVDTATAFDERSLASMTFATGVGGALRLQLLLGYYGTFVARAGAARGLTSGGIEQGYVVLGASS